MSGDGKLEVWAGKSDFFKDFVWTEEELKRLDEAIEELKKLEFEEED